MDGHFNYRIVRTQHGRGEDLEFSFRVFECYYELGADPGSVPSSWTAEPVAPVGETLGELSRDLEKMVRAFELPVLANVDGRMERL